MAKIISSLPGSTGVLSKTSQLINDGETGISTYVELNDLSTVATTGDYNNLINIPIDFTPKVHTHNISDISGTKSEFNTSLTDGDFLFVGDVLNTPDATTTSKGVIKLAGDLAGTADEPTVPGLANKIDKVAGKSLIADAEIARLATLDNYTHPANHPPSIITQDLNNRFVTDAEKSDWNNKQIALGFTPENVANKNTANGYAGLGSDGKLISSQLPSITISDTFVTASQAAMLALTAETGDVAVRTDLNKSYILKENNPTVLASWQELLTPTSEVTSVNGRTGAVVVTKADVSLNNADNTSDINKPISTATQTALNGKENSFTKNTAFNKPFGTASGTVAQGNDSRILNGQTAFGWGNHAGLYSTITGSNINQASFRTALGLGTNAYTSTAYLPLSGGTLSGALDGTSATFSSSVMAKKLSVSSLATGTETLLELGEPGYVATNYGSALESSSATGLFSLFNYNAGVKSTTPVLSWSRVNSNMTFGGAATFSSTVTASPATASNHVVVKSQLDAVVARPYKVYTALLTQTGSNVPVATVLENTLGGSISFSRVSAGIYRISLTGAFTDNKTGFSYTRGITNNALNVTNGIRRVDNDTIEFNSVVNGSVSDGQTINDTIEIRVYN